MAGSDFDWAAFEDELHAELHHALARLGRAQRGEEFYAVALHGVYRELDRVLTLPVLAAANLARTPATPVEPDFWGPRWNPAEWTFSEIDLRKRPTLRLERRLTAEATRGSQAHFAKVEARYFRILVEIAKRLRDEAPTLLRVTDEFVAFVSDGEGGPELAARSIPKRRFEALFSAQVERRAAEVERAALDPGDRARFLVTRLDEYEGGTTEDAQRELLSLGPEAIPALLGVIGEAKVGWTAAKLLGQIGQATPEIVHALRRGARSSFWHAMVLGILGDQAWLATQPPEVAVPGLCGPLKAITDARVALDYAPLERWLDGVDKAAAKRVADELAPGRSYVRISKTDVDEAIRGLASKHAVVRWHAASVLGERRLGAAAGKAALPALAAALRDRHAYVRRLAVLSISAWKAAAEPHRGAIEALRDDPDASVRDIAAYVLAR